MLFFLILIPNNRFQQQLTEGYLILRELNHQQQQTNIFALKLDAKESLLIIDCRLPDLILVQLVAPTG